VPDLARAIETKAGSIGALDLGAKHVIALGPRRPLAGICKAGGMFVPERWGDCQFAADRLDPQVLVIGVDEPHHHLSRRSSSACAKYADALRKISLARRSSFTSRSSNFSRALSSGVNRPGFPGGSYL
jgi:hypothetical protein